MPKILILDETSIASPLMKAPNTSGVG